MESKEYFGKIADVYADDMYSIQPEFYKNSAIHVDAAVAGKRDVLDIGNGGMIYYDYEKIPNLVCADLTVSPSVQKKFASNNNIRFIQSDILGLRNIKDCQFDVVIVSAVIHHLAGKTLAQSRKNTIKALRSCLRVLRPGGCIVIIESTVVRWFERVEQLCYPLMQLFFRCVKFCPVYQFSNQSLHRLLCQNHFSVKAAKKINIGPTIWIMNRKVPTALTPCTAVYFKIEKARI